MDTAALPTVQQGASIELADHVRNEHNGHEDITPSQDDKTITEDRHPVADDKAINSITLDPEALSTPSTLDDFPEGGLQAWLVLAGSFLALFPSFGFMVSIGTIQEFLQSHQLSAYTSRDIGWIPSVFVYLSLGLGIWVGPLFDRYGPRWIALSGSVAYVLMMFLLAECRLYWQFLLCLGFLGGISGATLTTTSLAVVSHWFKRRRGLAVGISMVGSSFGGLTIPLMLRATLPKYGYAWSIRILAFLFLACLTLANILMKPRLPPSPAAKNTRIISLSLFGDLKFTFLTISVFMFEVVLFGALGILPTYATYRTTFPPDTGFYIISVLNASSCFGRIIPGYISDRLGRFNTLLASVLFVLVLEVVLWLPFGHSSLAGLYVFSALFGFGTGCWMALTPACIGQLCEAESFGTWGLLRRSKRLALTRVMCLSDCRAHNNPLLPLIHCFHDFVHFGLMLTQSSGRYYGTVYFLASLSTLVCIPITGELIESVGSQQMVGFM
jgi:MFS family permease